MTDATLEDLRYPIGRFDFPEDLTTERADFIDQITQTPAALASAVSGLDDEQLDTPYRPDGWTVRQVVHHVADSHLNSYIRFKLAVTEDQPQVKLYDEKLWAELDDGRAAPIDLSLTLLSALHERWTRFLRSLDESQFSRTLLHPDYGSLTLDQNLAIYAWHGRHHVAHITNLRQRNGWH